MRNTCLLGSRCCAQPVLLRLLRVTTTPLAAHAPRLCHAQRATLDLVNIGDSVEAEKDALLQRFFVFARHACAALAAAGHWADYIDPCSGLPVRRADRLHAGVRTIRATLAFAHTRTCPVARR
jgi:hypothetical protein